MLTTMLRDTARESRDTMGQQPRSSAVLPTDSNDAAVAADCFRAAAQMSGGRVRDALLAMGRDYSARARAAAQTASFRIELAQARHAAPASWLGRLLEALMPATPVRRATARVGAPAIAQTTAPAGARPAGTTRPAPVRPQPNQPARASARGTRLFRMHALTLPGA